MTTLDASADVLHGEGVVVVIPCHNEEVAIERVVSDFRRELPRAQIIVVNNASTDQTSPRAAAAGATVLSESRRGKGFALLTGFRAAPDAQFIVMVDGDDTYPANEIAALLTHALSGADMVIGTRLQSFESHAHRRGHTFGNRIFISLVRILFGVRTADLFSGFRVLTRRFLETSPLIAQGFEIETELSLQALAGHFVVVEVPIHYRARPQNSFSKLRTFRDGYRILMALLTFFRDYRPLTFFGGLASLLFAGSLYCGGIVVQEYMRTGMVLRVPLAILSVGLGLLAGVASIGGLMLSSINRRSAQLAALLQRR